MNEIPKRLAPTRDTLRQLYLKSGNRCAFPGCKKALFNKKGLFVAQICHIEAAEPRGERFNKDQSNEQRRSFDNLLLLCYDHHIETNDVLKFPVNKMQRIKGDHEKIFSDVVESMLLSVSDQTELQAVTLPLNLKRIDQTLHWNHSDEELSTTLQDIVRFVERLKKLPKPSRELLLVMANRSAESPYGDGLEVSVPEVQLATNLLSKDLRNCLSILDKYSFVKDNGRGDMGVEMVGLTATTDGWHIWKDLINFCKLEKIDLAELVISLDWSRLDRPD